jgi:spermidine synthase
MSPNRPPLFEEIDRQITSIGEISLRRRWDPSLETEIHEVKLDDDFLMSTLFTVAEQELAHRVLALVDAVEVDVLVGGLGLGYTAAAALEDARIRQVDVVEMSSAVVGWHRDGLVPLGAALSGDGRCRFVTADFFELMRSGASVGAGPVQRYDAVLLDIDHAPAHLLHERHADFYSHDGLSRVRDRLRPGGVFGMWSDGAEDPRFTELLGDTFGRAEAEAVSFPNPYTGADSTSTVYLAPTR